MVKSSNEDNSYINVPENLLLNPTRKINNETENLSLKFPDFQLNDEFEMGYYVCQINKDTSTIAEIPPNPSQNFGTQLL